MGSSAAIQVVGLVHTAVGITLLAAGIAALNQYLEREVDALMRRTQSRPLPTGRVSETRALVFGVTLSLAAEVYLAYFVNPLCALLGFVALGSYLFLYTPLKTRTTWCTFVGAFPGALPPLLGWAAARNGIGPEAWILCGILFLWQFPHFHAIASMYREDYKRAGIKMLPAVETDGRRTAAEIVLYSVALLVVSVLPVVINLSGKVYLAGALALGVAFLAVGIRTAREKTHTSARQLLKASVLYLPLLLLLMILDS
jgi:protoheme IX farnesyltransferase